MRPTVVEQDGIRITQEQPDSVVIEMNGFSVPLTEENTERLRVMLYEAYRSKRWKSSRAEKSAKNKALWGVAKTQGAQSDNAQKKRKLRKETVVGVDELNLSDVGIGDFDLSNIGIGELDLSNIGIGDFDIEDLKLPGLGELDLPDYDYKDLGL